MMYKRVAVLALAFCLGGCALQGTGEGAGKFGPFAAAQDLGAPSRTGAGSTTYDPRTKSLTVIGGGANVWGTADHMQFTWKKMSGDVSLATDVAFGPATPGADPHRKVVVMIRQSLDSDSAYADATIHGNGMTALQWREKQGDRTFQLQANVDMPRRVRLEKRGDYFSIYVGTSDGDMQPAGGACKVPMTGDFYIGLGVCSHNADRLESATFSNIAIAPLPAGTRTYVISTLEVFQDTANRDRKVVWTDIQPAQPSGQARFEAPNWTKDNMLLFNYAGRLLKVPAILPSSNPTSVKVSPELVNTGNVRLNNDHILSFDGTMLVLSGTAGSGQSAGWTVPVGGGTPTRVTPNTPSYMHGWSPDARTLVFAAPRNPSNNNGNWDIYSIPSNGGTEVRLTTDPAREDGPEFSPDGEYIYFNSSRSGMMQIWRMRPDGTEQEQVTRDLYNNWFPHISPNGQKMVFLSFDKNTPPDDHDGIKDVELRMMNLQTKAVTTVVKLFGGQGTINVPSWSPDSQYFAFVSYQMIRR